MHFIDATMIGRVLSFPALVDALHEAHKRPRMQVHDALLGSKEAAYFVRSAHDRGRYMASKLITSFPDNPARSAALPTVQAIFILFDGKDGRPLATMDGTALTHWRTAADSALAARFLAPPEPRTLLIVGAGQMSRWLAKAHCAISPTLDRVVIWNRDARRAGSVATELRRGGIEAHATDDLAAATRAADIISTCTGALQPLVHGADLKPGTHLDLVGSYRPDMREADDEAIRRSRIFVDLRESGHDVGELQIPIANGVLREDDIVADHYELAAGTAEGRRSPGEITLFKNAGGGHLDLMTAECVLDLLGRSAR